MELRLERDSSVGGATLGTLYLDGVRECFTLEDVIRPEGVKVPGETAIPQGRYQVIVTHSQHFDRDLPLLLDVPMFDGARIHPGNTPKDTEGCILVGVARQKASILQSRVAFDLLFAKMQKVLAAGEKIFLTIENPASYIDPDLTV